MPALIVVVISTLYVLTVLLLSFFYRRERRDVLYLIECASFAVITFVVLGVLLLIVLAQIELGRAMVGNVGKVRPQSSYDPYRTTCAAAASTVAITCPKLRPRGATRNVCEFLAVEA